MLEYATMVVAGGEGEVEVCVDLIRRTASTTRQPCNCSASQNSRQHVAWRGNRCPAGVRIGDFTLTIRVMTNERKELSESHRW
jgi:hypothetical protein